MRTEYDTAVIRAQQAAEWEQFKENADVMPNLRWMPTSPATPREAHKVFWANELTLPVDDPFWNSHKPGDLWNCKCGLMQTNEPATKKGDIPSGGNVPKPAKGLKGNPGKMGDIFSADHNFMSDSCATCFLNRDGKVHVIGSALMQKVELRKVTVRYAEKQTARQET
ncbi:MAG: phage head morphogenesis protein [Paludibacteraceae bacterium]|nr:phage head morphogenesis protein [Paludibacteraceae bacterium]